MRGQSVLFPERVMRKGGGKRMGVGMVVRFQLVARPYEIKAWGEGVDEWWVGSSLTSDVGGSMLFQRTVKR
jgi:hypothetical protein